MSDGDYFDIAPDAEVDFDASAVVAACRSNDVLDLRYIALDQHRLQAVLDRIDPLVDPGPWTLDTIMLHSCRIDPGCARVSFPRACN